jgi:hypothetical protein
LKAKREAINHIMENSRIAADFSIETLKARRA